MNHLAIHDSSGNFNSMSPIPFLPGNCAWEAARRPDGDGDAGTAGAAAAGPLLPAGWVPGAAGS